MNTTSKPAPDLSLSVQYAVVEPRLPRWRIRAWVRRALEAAYKDLDQSFDGASLTVRLVGATEARRLNASFRNKDYATNVLTFAYGMQTSRVLGGDIVICVPVLQREAKAQRKTFLAHAAHLTLHGTLHALGYDHVKTREAKEMESLETRVLAQMNIHNPYLLP